MENGYLTNDYLIERYLSWEGRGPGEWKGHVGEDRSEGFSPVSAAR